MGGHTLDHEASQQDREVMEGNKAGRGPHVGKSMYFKFFLKNKLRAKEMVRGLIRLLTCIQQT